MMDAQCLRLFRQTRWIQRTRPDLRQRLNIPFDPNFSATPPTPADLANQHALDILGR